MSAIKAMNAKAKPKATPETAALSSKPAANAWKQTAAAYAEQSTKDYLEKVRAQRAEERAQPPKPKKAPLPIGLTIRRPPTTTAKKLTYESEEELDDVEQEEELPYEDFDAE